MSVGAFKQLPNEQPRNILAFLPTETRSHFNGFKSLLEALVARGHNLTLVSPYSLGPNTSIPYRHVRVEVRNPAEGSYYTLHTISYTILNEKILLNANQTRLTPQER